MKIGQKFNQLTVKEYCFYIDHYRKYTDFNTLGLYRSILENDRLGPADRLAVRDYAHKTFRKTFDFLQLKDPQTYFDLTILGQDLTAADKQQHWGDIRAAQQQILADKKIRHRNFGTYSKHSCGYDTCPFQGLMIRQGSHLAYGCMHFSGDRNKHTRKDKSDRWRADRKRAQQIVQASISTE